MFTSMGSTKPVSFKVLSPIAGFIFAISSSLRRTKTFFVVSTALTMPPLSTPMLHIGHFVAFDGDDAQTIECDQVTSKGGRLGDFFGGHRNVFYAFDGGLVEH